MRAAADQLRSEGYKVHVARKVRVRLRRRYINIGEDFWGAFDILATRTDGMRLIQVTTYPHDSTRRKAIDALPLPPPDPRLRYEVWAWNNGRGWAFWVREDPTLVFKWSKTIAPKREQGAA